MNTRQRVRRVDNEAVYVVGYEPAKVKVTLKRADILKTLRSLELIQVKADLNHSLTLVIYLLRNLE
jgi:hypothetical protein